MRYKTAVDFRRALESRLLADAREGGVDVNRMRRALAFERFLARLFQEGTERWVLKGGYALELRFPGRARSTRDLDLNVPPPVMSDLLEELQLASRRDLGDFFEFRVNVPVSGGVLPGPPLGGYHFNIEARLAGRQFISFPLDVGQGDTTVREPDLISGQVDLNFAGIPTPWFPVYPVEDHFAEKLHAYTTPRESPTRVKDLVDMMLLIEQGMQPTALLNESIDATFNRYERHPRPAVLPAPPPEWQDAFSRMAGEVNLSVTVLADAYEILQQFLSSNEDSSH